MNICFDFLCTGITSESETFSTDSTNQSALGHGDFVVIVVTKNLLIPGRRLWLGINSQTAGNSGEPSNILWKGWRSALFNFSNANMAFPTSDIADFQVSKEEISTLEMFRNFAITCHFDLDFRKFDFLLRSLSEKSLRWFWTDWQTFLPNENRTQRSMEGKF